MGTYIPPSMLLRAPLIIRKPKTMPPKSKYSDGMLNQFQLAAPTGTETRMVVNQYCFFPTLPESIHRNYQFVVGESPSEVVFASQGTGIATQPKFISEETIKFVKPEARKGTMTFINFNQNDEEKEDQQPGGSGSQRKQTP